MTQSAETQQAQMWGMLCHLAAFAFFIIPPVGGIVGPIIVWQIKKNEFPFVDDQGKESVNFQLSVFLYLLVSIVLMFVGIGVVLFAAIAITTIVLTILAGIKANQGEHYRYPFSIRWIR